MKIVLGKAGELFFYLSSRKITEVRRPVIKPGARVACLGASHLPNTPQIYTRRTLFHCGAATERAGQSTLQQGAGAP